MGLRRHIIRYFILILALCLTFGRTAQAAQADPLTCSATPTGALNGTINGADSTDNSTAVQPFGTCDNPVPLGSVVEVTSGHARTFRMTIAQILRGDEAWKRLSYWNPLNAQPDADKEYFMALVIVRYMDGPTVLPADFREFSFQLLSEGALSDEAAGIVSLRPAFKIPYETNTPGGGWVVLQVDPNDPQPVLVLNPQLDPDSQFYFATVETNP